MVLSSLFFSPQGPLPKVFSGDRTDILQQQLRQQAATAFQRQVLPGTAAEWEQQRQQLRAAILRSSGAVIDHALPLDVKETGRTQQQGYSIRNIYFQTRPGVYATANVYIPDGKGPFPAVVNMHGHWKDGRMGETVRGVSQTLAMNGYVCLSADAWGAGERTTVAGVAEYHGANLGASLMNTGNTLLGMQLTDNMRGVDLLCSMPEVDKERIGATGASGGGNQTMWLTAMDERIKASVPVVSVGTFESYILNSNCVCELLPGGLTYTEEAGVLSLVAPRALKICNALNDNNKAFAPSEMLRSYKNAGAVYDLLRAHQQLSYQLFNTTHGYWPEIREAMLGWMDLYLKGTGTGAPKKEAPFELLPPAQLLTFPDAKRPDVVMSTAAWCRQQGHSLPPTTPVNVTEKRNALKQLLGLNENRAIKTTHSYSPEQGWKRMAIEATDGSLIPLLLRAPADPNKGFVVVTHPGGKDSIAASLLHELTNSGSGVVLVDLWGTGEQSSAMATTVDGALPPFHTLARSALWLGATVQGKWVNDLQLILQYLQTQYGNVRIWLNGSKEAGVACLLTAALGNRIAAVTLENSPVSYRFDEREGIDFFSMAVHIPGFIVWGDMSLAAALSGTQVVFHGPVSMSGRAISGEELDSYKNTFNTQRKQCKQAGETVMVAGR